MLALAYEPVIPYKADKLDRVSLLALRIEGRALMCNKFSSEDFSAELNKNVLLVGDPCRNKGTTSSSSSYASSDSSDSKEEGEGVDQLILNKRRGRVDPAAVPEVPAAEPILVSSSEADDSDDLAFVPL